MKFTKQTTFLGRNGVFKATGLEITRCLDADDRSVIVLEPVTSKGVTGRCNIEIPPEDIPALIVELQKFNLGCRKCGCKLKKGQCTDKTCDYHYFSQFMELDKNPKS